MEWSYPRCSLRQVWSVLPVSPAYEPSRCESIVSERSVDLRLVVAWSFTSVSFSAWTHRIEKKKTKRFEQRWMKELWINAALLCAAPHSQCVAWWMLSSLRHAVVIAFYITSNDNCIRPYDAILWYLTPKNDCMLNWSFLTWRHQTLIFWGFSPDFSP